MTDDTPDGAADLEEEVVVDADEIGDDLADDVIEDDIEDDIDDEFASDDDVDEADDDPAIVADLDESVGDVPARRKKVAAAEDEEEEEDDEDPDDVEADLDTILKDKIASGDDLDDDEDEVVPDRNDPDSADGVAAKREGEFTCELCFLIVHPRQFGRAGALECPEGYEDCPSVKRLSRRK